MEIIKKLERAKDTKEKVHFCIDIANLCQDISNLEKARNEFYMEIMTNCNKMTKGYIVDRSNTILDRYCRKYGISYRCVRFDYALVILNKAINDMAGLAIYKGVEEAVKRQLKMCFQN